MRATGDADANVCSWTHTRVHVLLLQPQQEVPQQFLLCVVM